jgi:hypothetical protein
MESMMGFIILIVLFVLPGDLPMDATFESADFLVKCRDRDAKLPHTATRGSALNDFTFKGVFE